MAQNDWPIYKLPQERLDTLTVYLEKKSLPRLIVWGLTIYFLIVVIVSLFEFCAKGPINYIDGAGTPNEILMICYFNFITILTVGFGDCHPCGFGFRLITILEALSGVGIFSAFISILVIKILLPRKDCIVFSKYAYYCTEDNKFLVIYLNITHSIIVNADTSAYYKSGDDWKVNTAKRSPFITDAVQTFFCTEEITLDEIVNKMKDNDMLRVGISGNLGVSTFSTCMEYNLDQIVVIKNRKELTEYPGFKSKNVETYLKNHYKEFIKYFYYEPDGSKFLREYLKDN